MAFVAQWLLVVPAALVVAAILWRRRWVADIAQAALAGAFTVIGVKIAGALHFESRPFVVEHVRPLIPHAADNAFPSDHLAACGLAVAYLWPRSKPAAVLALLCAAAIGAARVLARVHWPDDIFAGFLIGVFATVLACLCLARLFVTRRV